MYGFGEEMQGPIVDEDKSIASHIEWDRTSELFLETRFLIAVCGRNFDDLIVMEKIRFASVL